MANTNYGGNGFLVANASATQGPFALLGGKYGITCVATFGGGTVDISILGPDGSTYVIVFPPASDVGTYPTHTFSANNYFAVDLPPCEVEVVIATASAVYVSCIPISNRR
jgi:hypothetical protein